MQAHQQTPASLDLAALLFELEAIRSAVVQTQASLLEQWKPHLPGQAFQTSAGNLAAYIGLRRHDLRALQHKLVEFGLSSLGRCEGHVLATLDAVINAIQRMLGQPIDTQASARLAGEMNDDLKLLAQHTDRLLGPPPKGRWTRFMVTLPSEAATDYAFVRQLVERGMDCARINSAHDTPDDWQKMADHVRRAAQESARPCKILVDLPGPKLRTGPMQRGAPVVHAKVRRDAQGSLLQPPVVVLDGSGAAGQPAYRDKYGREVPARLSVDPDFVGRLETGDRIEFEDAADRHREFTVADRVSADKVHVLLRKGAYIAKGTRLKHRHHSGKHAHGADVAVIGEIESSPLEIHVLPHETLLLSRRASLGEAEQRDEQGQLMRPGHVALGEPRIIDDLETGQPVWIDDGKVRAVIEKIDDEGAWLRVTHTRPEGGRIGAEKSLNFPQSRISLPTLAEQDLAALNFAVSQADIVGLSFVRSAADVDQVVEALHTRKAWTMGIIAKIETQAAVKNLPEIIVRGAGRHPFGVMIARGDLAVEIGYERLAEIQEEILWVCEAAHAPVVWATQVLENMVKYHLPSRAEITDVAMAERAECIMLNKGPYVLEALDVLDNVVARMRDHQFKKTARLRALHW
jgi:pyruvate kinase